MMISALIGLALGGEAAYGQGMREPLKPKSGQSFRDPPIMLPEMPPEDPPVFFAVQNAQNGAYVAVFETKKEASDFISANTVNGSIKGGMANHTYKIVESPVDAADSWHKVDKDNKDKKAKKAGK